MLQSKQLGLLLTLLELQQLLIQQQLMPINLLLLEPQLRLLQALTVSQLQLQLFPIQLQYLLSFTTPYK